MDDIDHLPSKRLYDTNDPSFRLMPISVSGSTSFEMLPAHLETELTPSGAVFDPSAADLRAFKTIKIQQSKLEIE